MKAELITDLMSDPLRSFESFDVLGQAAAQKQLTWLSTARPNQITPPSDWWRFWLILAGRGWGKTKTGVEDMAWHGIENPGSRIALLGPTAADCRDTIVEGVSGILTAIPPSMVVNWNRSLGEILLTNGTLYKTFSAEEPERLRGPQFHRAYCDEIAAWSRPETFDMLMFGLRLGNNPQCVITTTPKPILLLKQLLGREGKDVLVTRGRTLDNQQNLAPGFVAHMIDKYGGTRLGRQELDAELLEDTPGALWRRADIDEYRVITAPQMIRVVVAIDPAVSTNEGSDETGIVAAGKGIDGRYYILSDRSGRYTPDAWAREAIAQYKLLSGDRVIGEVNNGGDLIENTLRNIDRNVSYKAVHANKGKYLRAEPVAALYEQHKVSHIGSYPTLEDQMCIFTSDYDRKKMRYSPDRLDALVYALTELAIEDSPGANIMEYWAQKDAEEAAKVATQSGSASNSSPLPSGLAIASQCDFESHLKNRY